MSTLFNPEELAARVTREKQAAEQAKCDKSRRAHLALADQYQHKLGLVDSVKESIRISFG
jgi:hypothetical protein